MGISEGVAKQGRSPVYPASSVKALDVYLLYTFCLPGWHTLTLLFSMKEKEAWEYRKG